MRRNAVIFALTLLLSPPSLALAAQAAGPHKYTRIMTGGFGDKLNIWSISKGVVWNDDLYLGAGGGLILNPDGEISQAAKGCSVWRSTNGTAYAPVAEDGFNGDDNNFFILSFQEFLGKLYVGVLNPETGGQLWRTANGTAWEQVIGDGFGDPTNFSVTMLTVFNGDLYAGLWSTCCGAQLWRSSDGDSWTPLTTDGFGYGATNSDVAWSYIHAGKLYLAVENWGVGLMLFRTSDGLAFERVAWDGLGDVKNVNIEAITFYKGWLYIGTWNAGGPRLFRSLTGDTGSWQPVATPGISPSNNFTIRFTEYGDYLFGMVSNPNGPGASIWRTSDGVNWSWVMKGGFGDIYNMAIPGQVVFNDRLYLGLYNQEGRINSTGAQLWRVDPPSNDPENDGRGTLNDNCPAVYNPDQTDADGDGVGAACDCDDANAARPGPTPGCGQCTDADGDGYSPQGGACGPIDCNDASGAVHPGATDACGGGDANCDGVDGYDLDQDGHGSCEGDCNDNDPNVHPNRDEVQGNGKDDDCDGQTDEAAGCSPLSGGAPGAAAGALLYGLAATLVAGVGLRRRLTRVSR